MCVTSLPNWCLGFNSINEEEKKKVWRKEEWVDNRSERNIRSSSSSSSSISFAHVYLSLPLSRHRVLAKDEGPILPGQERMAEKEKEKEKEKTRRENTQTGQCRRWYKWRRQCSIKLLFLSCARTATNESVCCLAVKKNFCSSTIMDAMFNFVGFLLLTMEQRLTVTDSII